MAELPDTTIFRELFNDAPFVDRYEREPENAVDIIIPVIHSNELFRSNLLSFYREIPVNRLLLGDGGVIDDTLKVASEFPRVEVLDHTRYHSQGYSIRKLIEAVETEWFIYLHADVYLPPGWFETMNRHRSEYDWFECPQCITPLFEYMLEPKLDRSYSGSQMGRTSAFADVLPQIDDDYLFRNEDIIIASLVKDAGKRWGRVDDTFHYHQVMNRRSKRKRQFTNVRFDIQKTPEEDIWEYTNQIRGIIKYLKPDDYLIYGVQIGMDRLRELDALDWEEFIPWVKQTNPAWLPYLHKTPPFKQRLRTLLKKWALRVLG
jgi:hypothetical protein